MRSATSRLLSLLAATTAALAATNGPASGAIPLTDDTFHDFVQEHDLVLANFYIPWCRWSKMLDPHFEIAATVLREDDIPLAKIDCMEETDICAEYDIGIFPSMEVFRGPESHKSYDGSRSAESIIFYMQDESISTEDAEGLYVQTYD